VKQTGLTYKTVTVQTLNLKESCCSANILIFTYFDVSRQQNVFFCDLFDSASRQLSADGLYNTTTA